MKDLNGAQAAIRAGYSPHSARITASKMLANVSISKAIHEAQDEILKENQVTVARIVRELALIAFFDPASLYDESGRLLPVNELPPEIRHALPAIDIVEYANGARHLRFAGKLAALLALCKHTGMFSDRFGGGPTDPPRCNSPHIYDEDGKVTLEAARAILNLADESEPELDPEK